MGLEGGVNTYGYAEQNPLLNTDEFGLFIFGYFDKGGIIGVIPPPKVPGKYACTARCAMLIAEQTCPPPDCSGVVYGYAESKDRASAVKEAKANAKPSPGCQLKHCNYACRDPKGSPYFPSQN